MAAGYYRWIRRGLDPRPDETVRQTLVQREANFLHLAKTAIFEHPRNPFHSLFAWAGCSYADLEALVRRNGLEPALMSLYRAGVYLTHDEFKGKVPAVRGGNSLTVDTGDLGNPSFRGMIGTSSSGSRSRGTTTMRSVEYNTYREAQFHVFLKSFDIERRPFVSMSSILPNDAGLRNNVMLGLRGTLLDKWFCFGSTASAWHYRAMTSAFLTGIRAMGVPVIYPEYLPRNDFRPVAEWLARRRSQGTPCFVSGVASAGVRVAAAAIDHGLDISGTLFSLGGEALTPAKQQVVREAGAKLRVRYTISELGPTGASCPGLEGNSVHVCMDSVAVISRRREAPLSGTEVESLLFTALHPTAATVLINTEMDDAGTLSTSRCDCELHRMGFTQTIEGIYSYGKLTGQGTTLVGSAILEILESSLPRRFGGVPGDFQLVECEGRGQTDIELRVNPRLGNLSPDEIREFFLAEVRRLWTGSLTVLRWVQTDAVRVVLAEPHVSGGRKVHALHLIGAGPANRTS